MTNSTGRTVEVYKVRDHNLTIEEDPVTITEFAGLSDEQVDMLQRVVDDTVYYDLREVK